MKAIIIDEGKNLVWTDVADPTMGADEVIVEVYAAALNRADLLQRAGLYPPPPGAPEWPGLEVAGVIKAVGERVAQNGKWHVGDRVCALLPGGGYAEYVSVPEGMLMSVPRGMSLIEASAIPEAYATGYLNLFIEGNAKPGETLYMPAAKSGLASVVIPMAKAYGLRVITSVRGRQAVESVAYLNADRVIDSTVESVSQALKEEADAGHPVDHAIDCLSGKDLGESLPYVARGCSYIIIAALAGEKTEIDCRKMYEKAIRIIGSTLRSRPVEVKCEILRRIQGEIYPFIESGAIRPRIHRTFPIVEAEKAHEEMKDGKNVGKIVLVVKEEK